MITTEPLEYCVYFQILLAYGRIWEDEEIFFKVCVSKLLSQRVIGAALAR